MYKILFIQEFDWQLTQSEWGAWDIPSPYFDDTRNGWMLPDGWQEHLTERGIDFEEVIQLTGAFYRRTDQLDENGNYYLEVSESITLGDGTIIDSSNYQLGDGVDGWHWYVDGETVTIASPSAWEKIKNFFNIG